MTSEILIGTEGWDHDDWVGEFYPDELPSDWRFCYYSNKMRAVLVPFTVWSVNDAEADAKVVAQWRTDSDAAFRFVLELPPALMVGNASAQARAVARFLSTLTPLHEQIAGCVVRCDLAPVDDAALAYALAAVGAHYTVCVQAQGEGRSESLIGAASGSTWDADRDPAPAPGGTLLVARSAGGSPRVLRAVLEKVAQAGAKQGAVFFKPSPQAMTFAAQARSLAEMMGI